MGHPHRSTRSGSGRPFSAFLISRASTPDVIAVLESGEETGKTPETLNHLADDYEEQVSVMVKNLGHLIQPLLVIFLGGIVLFIILAVLLPYIQMITSLAG
jgi:type IV pilus assembly protein PilC